VRTLRATEEELIVPAPYSTIPGVLSWRRPEVLSELTRVLEAEQDPVG
jgi:omega-amidase